MERQERQEESGLFFLFPYSFVCVFACLFLLIVLCFYFHFFPVLLGGASLEGLKADMDGTRNEQDWAMI